MNYILKDNKKQVYRHGEIHFVLIDKLPDGIEKEKTNVIMKGSHGHDHSFKGGKLYLKNVDEFVFGYFIAENTILYHPEHGEGKGKLLKAKLPNGIYELRRQNEYTPDGLKPVID